MSDTEMEQTSEREEEEVEAAAPASKKGKKKSKGRKSGGGGGGGGKKKVAKTPTKGVRTSGRKVKPATPKSAPAPAPKKSKSKGAGSRGRPKSAGKQKKEDKDWEVEKILGVKKETSRKEFLVKWKGWAGKPTWEPEANVEGCHDLVQDFVNSL